MKSVHALIVAFVMCFVCAACDEEIADQSQIPKIYSDAMAQLYSEIDSKTSCDDLYNTLKTFKNNFVDSDEGEESAFVQACADYIATKGSSGGVERVATDLTNSGYYMAAFILADRYYSKAGTCTASASGQPKPKEVRELYSELFESPNCAAFLTDAKTMVQKYSKVTIK